MVSPALGVRSRAVELTARHGDVPWEPAERGRPSSGSSCGIWWAFDVELASPAAWHVVQHSDRLSCSSLSAVLPAVSSGVVRAPYADRGSRATRAWRYRIDCSLVDPAAIVAVLRSGSPPQRTRVDDDWRKIASGAAEQGDEADEAFGGTNPRAASGAQPEVPPNARAG